MARVDLHVHSNLSDGSDSLQKLAENIIKNNVEIFALTDHDTVDGIEEIKKYIPSNIKFIPAVELTCKAGDIKCHILGYGIDTNNTDLKKLIEKGKILRRQKLETRVKYLKEVWKIELTKEELDWLYSRKTCVKTHFANILVNRGLANENQAAMRKYLDGCKTGNTRFDGVEAIETIKKADGIPVWAHSIGGEGEEHISEIEFLEKFKKMKNYGIDGLECYYSRYNQNEINMLLNYANINNMLISGGSDYHGKNKDIPLLQLNVDNNYVDSEKLTILKRLVY